MRYDELALIRAAAADPSPDNLRRLEDAVRYAGKDLPWCHPRVQAEKRKVTFTGACNEGQALEDPASISGGLDAAPRQVVAA